jgi:hypothetical protein
MLAPANSELPRGDGWVTSGLRAVFHKGKVVVRGREGMVLMVIHRVRFFVDKNDYSTTMSEMNRPSRSNQPREPDQTEF